MVVGVDLLLSQMRDTIRSLGFDADHAAVFVAEQTVESVSVKGFRRRWWWWIQTLTMLCWCHLTTTTTTTTTTATHHHNDDIAAVSQELVLLATIAGSNFGIDDQGKVSPMHRVVCGC